jgi:spore coat polysaccharide biosynthesis protein SpsF (cytidylyltransferase family)
MKGKITAVIQARLGSTRLPGKTMMMLEDEPLLGHLAKRIRAAHNVNDIIIATTVEKRDDAIVEFAVNNNLKYYRGSEDDVLDRFYNTCVEFDVDTIVRVTPDCPLLDPRIVDLVVSKYMEGNYDYVSNVIIPTFPDGLDTEVFSFHSLEKAWHEAELLSEREHVTAYIVKHPDKFSMFNVKRDGEDLAWMRWTVDTPKDFEFIKEIFSNISNKNGIFFSEDVIDVLNKKPELLEINTDIQRNEGYLKSLKKDQEHFGRKFKEGNGV